MKKRILKINDDYFPQYKGLFFWSNFEKGDFWDTRRVMFFSEKEALAFLQTNPSKRTPNKKKIIGYVE